MPLTKIGLNVTNIENLTAPTFDIANTTEEFINDIPAKANEISQGWLGFTILMGLFFWLQWKLHQDLYSGGDFGFSIQRSLGMSCSVCSIIGLYCLNMGYFTNYYHVALFIIGSFIFAGIVWKMQR